MEKNKMLKKLVKSAFGALGLELTRKGKSVEQQVRNPEAEVEQLISIVRNHSMVDHEGLVSLYEQSLFCEKQQIAGDFVECGVWKGGAVGLMALVNLRHGRSRRHIHLFDSWQGPPEPDAAVDGERVIREVKMWAKNPGLQGRLVALEGIYDHKGGHGTLEENQFLLEQTIGYDSRYLHYHKGWFEHTLPEIHQTIEKIAVFRFDGGTYGSTKVCLEYLFPKVVSGGFAIIDDYGTYEGVKKAVDEYLEASGRPLFLNHVSENIKYLIVP